MFIFLLYFNCNTQSTRQVKVKFILFFYLSFEFFFGNCGKELLVIKAGQVFFMITFNIHNKLV